MTIKNSYYFVINVETDIKPDADRESRKSIIQAAIGRLVRAVIGPKPIIHSINMDFTGIDNYIIGDDDEQVETSD